MNHAKKVFLKKSSLNVPYRYAYRVIYHISRNAFATFFRESRVGFFFNIGILLTLVEIFIIMFKI